MWNSPPEFPAWTDNAHGAISTATYIPDLACTTDVTEQEVRIKQEEPPQPDPSGMSLRVETTSVESVNISDTSQTVPVKIEPLIGGNSLDAELDNTVDVRQVKPLRGGIASYIR